jgi:hypothetical protein
MKLLPLSDLCWCNFGLDLKGFTTLVQGPVFRLMLVDQFLKLNNTALKVGSPRLNQVATCP